jgi:hypothetical protein
VLVRESQDMSARLRKHSWAKLFRALVLESARLPGWTLDKARYSAKLRVSMQAPACERLIHLRCCSGRRASNRTARIVVA